MTPDERAALDRQRRIARTPAIAIERHEPLEGQAILFTPTCEVCGTPMMLMVGRTVGWECPKCPDAEEDQ